MYVLRWKSRGNVVVVLWPVVLLIATIYFAEKMSDSPVQIVLRYLLDTHQTTASYCTQILFH